MAKVAVTAGAADFRPDHPIGGIHHLAEVVTGIRFLETWPPCTGFKFGRRTEQGQVTQDAGIGSLPLLVKRPTTECGLGSLFKKYVTDWKGEMAGKLVQLLRVRRSEIISGRRQPHGWDPSPDAGEPWRGSVLSQSGIICRSRSSLGVETWQI